MPAISTIGMGSSLLTLLDLTVRPLQHSRRDVADEYEILVGDFPDASGRKVRCRHATGSHKCQCCSLGMGQKE
jgi:hypothetical protein